MKTLIRCAICALFFSLSFVSETNAQVDDTLPPWFHAPFLEAELLATPALYKLESDFKILSSSLLIRSQMPSKKLNQSKQKPVRLETPFVLEMNDRCFQLGCVKNTDCEKCGLMWWDRNRDGKVQANKELRCICRDTKMQCQLRGRKVDCR